MLYRIEYKDYGQDFKIIINDKEFLIDYWDTSDLIAEYIGSRFKFHYIQEKTDVYAFTPVSFLDWRMYRELEKKIRYKATGVVM